MSAAQRTSSCANTSELGWQILEISCEKAVRNWYGGSLVISVRNSCGKISTDPGIECHSNANHLYCITSIYNINQCS